MTLRDGYFHLILRLLDGCFREESHFYTVDSVVICKSLTYKVEEFHVIDDFHSWAHKPVSVDIEIGMMDKWQRQLEKPMELS